MGNPDELVQIAERALADAEEALRHAPTEANQRRAISAWSFVRKAREAARRKAPEPVELPAEDPG